MGFLNADCTLDFFRITDRLRAVTVIITKADIKLTKNGRIK
jgi:hypothetical protein